MVWEVGCDSSLVATSHFLSLELSATSQGFHSSFPSAFRGNGNSRGNHFQEAIQFSITMESLH
jgi:hypothetical protein